ncbi:MAG: chromate efflux transporter [Akkermansiaceae bacterium]|nr:chromate efflux transporter [Akkermansiaceae bacterium]
MPGRDSMAEIFFSSLKLGLMAFGGPTAHLGYFREEYVHKRKWLSDADYSDLVALSQFLPGPGSSQTIFALGLKRGGWAGGALASLGFTLPSAMLMILFGYGISVLGDVSEAGWLIGLKLAAVAVVAKALLEMATKLCPDLLRAAIAVAACAGLLAFSQLWLQIGVIAAGAAIHWLIRSNQQQGADTTTPKGRSSIAPFCLVGFALLLVLLPVLAGALSHSGLTLFDRFYRAGSAVFGGGHVVLPLLETAVVPDGQVSEDAFLAGYGAAQAIPGPLFTFAGYLGTIADPLGAPWAGGLLCLFALFLPGWLLMAGALPYWESLRRRPAAKAALAGANAAVVGILAAALWNPVITRSIDGVATAIVAIIGFALIKWGKCPPWAWVLLAAGIGQALLG